MLFEPVLHDMYADEVRKAFTDWNGDPKSLNLILPVDAQPFDRTQIGYALNESTEKICEITVPSLRALFRGNGELVINRSEFKEEYVPFFYPIETTLVAVGQRLPESMILDDKFELGMEEKGIFISYLPLDKVGKCVIMHLPTEETGKKF